MAGHPPSGTVTFLLTVTSFGLKAAMSVDEAISYALANVDPEFLTGRITVCTESIADA